MSPLKTIELKIVLRCLITVIVYKINIILRTEVKYNSSTFKIVIMKCHSLISNIVSTLFPFM